MYQRKSPSSSIIASLIGKPSLVCVFRKSMCCLMTPRTSPASSPTKEAMMEELGDLRWYIQATMQMYDLNEQDILQYNANKLAVRYVSLRYSDEEAAARADKTLGE